MIEVYIAEIGILDVFGSCDLDLNRMTFIYELTRTPKRYTGCANMNFLRSVKALESYRLSDRYAYIQTDRIG